MDARSGSQEDLIFGIPGSSRWSDWRSWSRRQKIFIASSVVLSVAVLSAVLIVVIAYASTGHVIPPPTPTTTIPPTTSTTPATTTSSTTTTTSTTTSTTTPKTTTKTTPTTTITTSTTTPSTTTESTTSTTPSTTTPPSTGWIPPPTRKPLPVDPYQIPAENLLDQVGINPNYTKIACKIQKEELPVHRAQVTIKGQDGTEKSWLGDASRTTEAKTVAARNAAKELFNLDLAKYPQIAPPPYPCIPIPEEKLPSE